MTPMSAASRVMEIARLLGRFSIWFIPLVVDIPIRFKTEPDRESGIPQMQSIEIDVSSVIRCISWQ
jgi:hypothetical protein